MKRNMRGYEILTFNFLLIKYNNNNNNNNKMMMR